MIKITLLFLLTLQNLYAYKFGDVNWHEGTVESAFKRAKKENKSIFLYWGAVWCPPCNHMKKKVFTTKVFADEMKKFVPVYLDGDEKRAQVWGEKLGAKGYPTMLVLNPAGAEVTRLSTGMNAHKYVEVLKKARLQTLSIHQLLKKVETSSLNDQEWDILSHYSWQQDKHLQKSYLAEDKKELTFLNLYTKAPKAFKTKFFLQYLLTRKNPFTAKERKVYRTQFESILTHELEDNFEILAYQAPKLVKILSAKDKNLPLQKIYIEKMNLYRASLVKSAPKGRFEEKLMTYVPELFFIKVNQGKDYQVPKAYQKGLDNLVSQIAEHEKNKYARHSSLTSAVWLLSTAKLTKRAKDLALKEIKTSPHPYYYMSYLSQIELDLKDTKAALKWSKQAWQKSVGHATRFEWGTSYLLKLMKHDENNTSEIKTTYQSLMSEFKKEEATFSGRSKRRLTKLKSSINKWNEKYPKSKIVL